MNNVVGYKNCQRNKSKKLIISGLEPISQNQLLIPTTAIINKVNPKYLLSLLLKNLENRITKLKTKQWSVATRETVSKNEILIDDKSLDNRFN